MSDDKNDKNEIVKIETQKFGGLDISTSGFRDGKIRVRDIDLGEWLELARPRKIRESIKTLLDAGIINDSDCALVEGDVPIGNGATRKVTEYWLTEQAAIFVASRSDQPKGVLMLKALIAVFDEFRNANEKASRLLEMVFRDAPVLNHKKRLFCPLAIELSKFMENEWNGEGAPPVWIKSVASDIYKWALPISVEQHKRRELNKSPSGSSVDYNWLTKEGEDSLKDVLKAGEILASAAQSYQQWKNLMEHRYENKAIQLELLVKRAAEHKKLND